MFNKYENIKGLDNVQWTSNKYENHQCPKYSTSMKTIQALIMKTIKALDIQQV